MGYVLHKSKLRTAANPVDNLLNLALPDNLPSLTQLYLTDVQGREILRQQPILEAGSTLQIQVENLKAGVYFLTVTTGQYRWQKRFIKR